MTEPTEREPTPQPWRPSQKLVNAFTKAYIQTPDYGAALAVIATEFARELCERAGNLGNGEITMTRYKRDPSHREGKACWHYVYNVWDAITAGLPGSRYKADGTWIDAIAASDPDRPDRLLSE